MAAAAWPDAEEIDDGVGGGGGLFSMATLRRKGIKPLCANREGISPRNSHQCRQASAVPDRNFYKGLAVLCGNFKPIPMQLESKTSVAASLLCFSTGTIESHDTTPSLIAAAISRIASLQFAREKGSVLSGQSKDDRLNGQIPEPDSDAAALMCTSARVVL